MKKSSPVVPLPTDLQVKLSVLVQSACKELQNAAPCQRRALAAAVRHLQWALEMAQRGDMNA
jgi:hypothetical protein